MNTAHTLIAKHGRTFAEEAGITLRDKPAPLWQLLVLSLLLSTRIDAKIATRSAHELYVAGWRTPQRLLSSTWQQRVDALGRGGYRRYDESTATRLAEAAEHILTQWQGDLRKLHAQAPKDPERIAELLQTFKGIGPVGASIFLREVQVIWTDIRPYIDDLAVQGATALGLPTRADELFDQVDPADFHRLVAACVRCALHPSLCGDLDSAGKA
ncbi:MAG: endonuclease [Corynebacteriales bacterium]|nr:endonuclease [Mycobacteriales bacterium]